MLDLMKYDGHIEGEWYWSEDRFRGGYSGIFTKKIYEPEDPVVLWPQRENDGDSGAAWLGTDQNYYGEEALSDADASLIKDAPKLLSELKRLREIARLQNDWIVSAVGYGKESSFEFTSQDLDIVKDYEKYLEEKDE